MFLLMLGERGISYVRWIVYHNVKFTVLSPPVFRWLVGWEARTVSGSRYSA